MDEFVLAYFLTIAIESIVFLLLQKHEYPALLIVRNAIVASSLTLPFVWFVFPVLCSGFFVFGAGCWFLQTALAEIFAVVVESVAYRRLFIGISWKGAFFLSLICNIVSFGAGLILV